MKPLCIILSLMLGYTLNVMQPINNIYKIIDKANKFQELNKKEMYILLSSYKTDENNVELSQYRAFGISSIAQDHKNSITLLCILENNPCLFSEDFYENLCYDMTFSEEIEKVIDNLKRIHGYRDIKTKILSKLELLR